MGHHIEFLIRGSDDASEEEEKVSLLPESHAFSPRKVVINFSSQNTKGMKI